MLENHPKLKNFILTLKPLVIYAIHVYLHNLYLISTFYDPDYGLKTLGRNRVLRIKGVLFPLLKVEGEGKIL